MDKISLSELKSLYQTKSRLYNLILIIESRGILPTIIIRRKANIIAHEIKKGYRADISSKDVR